MHFSGSLAGELLARYLQQVHHWPVARDRARGRALGLLLKQPPPADSLPPMAGQELRRKAESAGRQLARLAQAGPYHKLLPAAWQHQLLESLLPYEELARAWSRAPIVSELPEGLEQILPCLALG